MYQKRIPLMVMYEGWDAAGKGGNIKRVAQALDARAYTIFPSPAPTRPELLHPHLWRYWTRLPKAGHVGIYDRSWYGRVLVERVEGLRDARAVGARLRRDQRVRARPGGMGRHPAEVLGGRQPRRTAAPLPANARTIPAKQWKITEEDWRNRDKYPQYQGSGGGHVPPDVHRRSLPGRCWKATTSATRASRRLEIIVEALEARLRETRVSGTMGGANLQ